MRPSTIKYLLKEGGSGLKTNMLMTMASIVAVAACVSIMAFSYCVISNVQFVLQQMEDSIGVAIFLEDDPTSDLIEQVRNEVLAVEHVTEVSYVSPTDALEELKDSWGAEEDIFLGLDDENNPLSHSFQVSLDDIENRMEVVSAVEGMEGIASVRHGQSETELLIAVNSGFSIGSVIILVVLGIISVMIIINTIRISVTNRRVEINIMKYVGATDWFIRWPFLVEGVFIGIVGAGIPVLIGLPLYSAVIDLIYQYIPFLQVIQFKLVGDIFLFLTPASILFGIALGVVGSSASIKKHLHV